ncbi:mycofactocin-coupled SDR family oxidoreductase [Mycobacterium sp. DL440]|uniref:mycofactocin-coupled SDR family oxidoreductase n=1 Tax=Mycobacterium sp. DL440 TaxID=2675523 RepID=UPI00142314A4|nr:mycofactocin-coupled SDR family oxidoreductase [Mycobacterium sp. DL440]
MDTSANPAHEYDTTGLRGKVVVVTGAAHGTGRVHCTRFADEGADVIALDIGSAAEGLDETAAEVRRRGSRCVSAVTDVRDLAAMKHAIDSAVAELGRLDVVVANAGIHIGRAPASELTEQAWDQTVAVNLTGVWHTVAATVKHIGADGGSIVLVSSTSGLRGSANSAHYSATKHAVVGLMQSLANELGPKMIRVNTVHPGAVGTGMVINEETFRRLRPDLQNPTAEDVSDVLAARHLLPVPWVDPVDVSNAVVFLASDGARYVTGTQLVVDAGLMAKT